MPILIGKVRPLGDERVGRVEHRLERLLRDDVLGPRVAGRLLHRAGRVDENRHGGAEPFFDFGLVGGVRGLILGSAAAGLTGVLAGSAPGCQHEERTEG